MEARVPSRDDCGVARRPVWEELDALLRRGRLHKRSPDEISRASMLYRAACTDLMRARSLRVGTDVTGYHHLLWEIDDNSVD